MKNILVISAYFPPIGGIGVQRISKQVKYLHKNGYNPIVITTPKYSTKMIHDESMWKDIPSEIEIYRPFFYEYSKIIPGEIRKLLRPLEKKILFPDQFVVWNYFVKKKILALKKRIDFSTVILNLSPFSGILLVKFLKEKLKLKVIVNLRDSFSFNFYYISQNRKKEIIKSKKIEEKTFKFCDSIILPTPNILKEYQKIYPKYKNKFFLIPNGFDEEDFAKTKIPPQNFTIYYSGSFSSMTPLQPLLRAVSGVNKKHKISIVVSIATNLSLKKIKNVYPEGYHNGYVKFLGFLPHKENILNFSKANLLAISLANNKLTADFVYSGKLLEYINADTPILLLNNSTSAAAKLIEKTHSGFCVNIDSQKDIQDLLFKLYSQWKKEKKIFFQPDKYEIQKYNYKNLIKLLIERIED